MMIEDLREILYTKEQIQRRVEELGTQITVDYAGKSPMLVGVLKGCFVFLADISRCIDLNCEIRFLTASSYGFSTVTSGSVRITKDTNYEIADRDIIIIEDILDSGVTLTALRNYLLEQNPASLKICALLDKPARRQTQIDIDYVGFVCPDEFLVGYGLDYAERYRNLPLIASLKPEIYS